jgi:hypothetical protein
MFEYSSKQALLPNGRAHTQSDDLAVVLHEQCRWNEDTNLDFLAKWLSIDYESAEDTTSMFSFPDRRFYIGPSYFVKEQDGGFESLPSRFAEDTFGDPLSSSQYLKFSERVSKIKYNLDPENNDDYYALVDVNPKPTDGCPTARYRAKRVIWTASVGVIASGDITFDPPLDPNLENPLVMKDFIKVFYRFKTEFWDDAEFIVSLQKEDNSGRCHHWQNLDFKSKAGGTRKQTS